MPENSAPNEDPFEYWEGPRQRVFWRFTTNLHRCLRLASVHEVPREHPDRHKYPVDDILRSAVVFCHASLEDLLRSVDELRRPDRPKHPRLTLNSVDGLATLLHRIKIDPEPFRDTFPDLDWLLRRRHKIVHEADVIERRPGDPQSRLSGPLPFFPEDTAALLRSIRAVVQFATTLLDIILPDKPDLRAHFAFQLRGFRMMAMTAEERDADWWARVRAAESAQAKSLRSGETEHNSEA